MKVKCGDFYWLNSELKRGVIVQVIWTHPSYGGIVLVKIIDRDIDDDISFSRCCRYIPKWYPELEEVCKTYCLNKDIHYPLKYKKPAKTSCVSVVEDLGRRLTRLEIALHLPSEVGGSIRSRKGSHNESSSESSPSSPVRGYKSAVGPPIKESEINENRKK